MSIDLGSATDDEDPQVDYDYTKAHLSSNVLGLRGYKAS